MTSSMATNENTAEAEVAIPAPMIPSFGAPRWPKISIQAATKLKATAQSMTTSGARGISMAVAKLRSTWNPKVKGRPKHSMAVNRPASRARFGACPRWTRIHSVDSRMGNSGRVSSTAAQSPIRTMARTPAFASGLAPNSWAIMGDTAMAGPEPSSQVK